ncbi:MAG: response regulator [Rhodospirillaceae bacterium]
MSEPVASVRGVSGLSRLAPAIAIATAVGLVVAGVIMAIYSERSLSDQQVRAAHVQAEILASSVTAALTFDDRAAAQDYIDALRANPEIRAAAVYDGDGRLFASLLRPDEAPLPAPVRRLPPLEAGNRLSVVVPVVHEGIDLGTIYLRLVVESVVQRLGRYVGIAILVVLAALVFVVLSVSQSALGRTHRELQRRAEELSAAHHDLQHQVEERGKVEEALRQAQKMETIGQLTGGVAHDFNNLLTIIMGSFERIRRGLARGRDPSEMQRAIDNGMQGVQRAAALTRSLLAFSRRQPLDPRPVDVNRLVAGMSDMLRRTLGEQVAIETVVAGGLWRTHVDPNQLENAILNLAVNARDAMPAGGKLTIETANAYLDERYAGSVADVEAGQYVQVCVTDTGTGMDREVLAKAFDPFFTTKSIGQGTGLGLSQVYGFVRQSGGHVRIYSEVGEGTAVKIYLPRLIGEEAALADDAAPALAHGAPHERILVVEDEDGVRERSVEILAELGYGVLQAADGREALAVLEREAGVALLFTDVGLPGGMNGRQLADQACAGRPGLKVLFTTGYARNAIVHDGRLDPGVRLITKPYTAEELAAAVRAALDVETRRPLVLVVEDEILVRMNTVFMLEEMGFRIDEAGTAADAVDKMRRADGTIGAAIIDIGLPDRRGDELTAELRALRPELPIVIASGYVSSELGQRFAGDPLVRFLGKPFERSQLAVALNALGVRAPDDED